MFKLLQMLLLTENEDSEDDLQDLGRPATLHL